MYCLTHCSVQHLCRFSKWEEVYKFGEEWRKQGVGGEPGPSQIQVAAGTLDVDDDAILCMCFIS